MYHVLSLFAGVGGIDLGFEQTNHFNVVWANEFDKYAGLTYKANNQADLNQNDIHIVDSDSVPNCDVIVGGFPCQAFSIAGYRKGFEDERGTLFFEMLRLIKAKQPKVVFIENVKNLITHDKGNTFKVIKESLEDSGYHLKWAVLNSKDYGNIPQNRERIYLVGFKDKNAFDKFNFPAKVPLTTNLDDIIDFNIDKDDKYYYTSDKYMFYPKLVESINRSDTIYQWRRSYVRENKSGVVPTLTAAMGMGGNNVPIIYTKDNRIRKLTPRETFNIQGFPKDFVLPDTVSDSQLYKQAGNSVTVPVIKRVAEQIYLSMKEFY